MQEIKFININDTHLIDDGDVTGNVSSIVSQTYTQFLMVHTQHLN